MIGGREASAAWLPPLLALLVSCAHPAPPRGAPRGAPQGGPQAPAPASWSYAVTTEDGQELRVEAELEASAGAELVVDEEAERFVRDVEVEERGGFRRVEAQRSSWRMPACEGACRVRYRYLLADAARVLDDVDRAALFPGVTLAPPSTWLLRPGQGAAGGALRLRVSTPPGLEFVSGLAHAGGVYAAGTEDLPEAPYAGFGAFRRRALALPGGTLDLAIAPVAFGVGDDALERWVRRAADAVVGYYGRLPLERTAVFLVRTEGSGVVFGKTLGNGGASIVMGLGALSEEALARDWVMPHELIHLTFPSMPQRHAWIEEGLATYIEPIARARAGQIPEEQVWRDFITSMPQGQPEPGDEGLDHTPTWGRTYWGGAIFCLLADVEIRRRSGNERSLDDALRAIVEAGGTVARRWSLEQALDAGDRATGLDALRALHRRHGSQAVPVDLAELWRALGVSLRGQRVILDDRAPLAAIRRAITARR